MCHWHSCFAVAGCRAESQARGGLAVALWREDLLEEALEVLDLGGVCGVGEAAGSISQYPGQRTGRRRDGNIRIRMEAHVHAHLPERLGRLLAKLEQHDVVLLAVRQEERRVLVGPVLGDVVRDAVAQQQVARQAEDAAQLLAAREPREDGHGAALREAAQHDARRLDALVDLVLDQAGEVVARAQDAGLVLVAGEFLVLDLCRQ